MNRSGLLCFLSACAILCNAQVAGKVTRVVEPAEVDRGTKTMDATTGIPVNWNDTLKTSTNGRERVVLNDGSILVLTSDASMKVIHHDEKSGKTQLELSAGYVRASVVGVTSGSTPNFEIRTSTALCGVLGTQFEIETTPEATQVHVHDGKVHFQHLASGQSMMLTKGQHAHIVHRTGALRQGLYPRFAQHTRARWQAEREDIQQELQERNQRRRERVQAERQAAAAEKRRRGKK